MSEAKERKSSIAQKMTKTYRVVFLDEDTLGEVRSGRISGNGIMLGILGFMLLTGLLTFFLVSYTPLRHLIPGYAEINNNRSYMELRKKLEEIEDQLDDQQVYTDGLKNIFNPSGQMVKAMEGNMLSNQSQSINGSVNATTSMADYFFCPPLQGEVSAAFDASNKHFGVDIVAAKDSPVKAILDGIIISADWSVKTGNTISIQHSHDLISVYKHNSTLLKKVGQKVVACEAIAIIGNSGVLTNGPHVHFEIWNNGEAVDPLKYIILENT